MIMNYFAGWVGIFVGILAGVITGLFFHDERYLGGYSSWQRRLTRLGHISLVGLGLLNLAAALTIQTLDFAASAGVPSVLLIMALVTMPLVCFGSAFYRPVRHLFFIPVLAALGGVGTLLWRISSL